MTKLVASHLNFPNRKDVPEEWRDIAGKAPKRGTKGCTGEVNGPILPVSKKRTGGAASSSMAAGAGPSSKPKRMSTQPERFVPGRSAARKPKRASENAAASAPAPKRQKKTVNTAAATSMATTTTTTKEAAAEPITHLEKAGGVFEDGDGNVNQEQQKALDTSFPGVGENQVLWRTRASELHGMLRRIGLLNESSLHLLAPGVRVVVKHPSETRRAVYARVVSILRSSTTETSCVHRCSLHAEDPPRLPTSPPMPSTSSAAKQALSFAAAAAERFGACCVARAELLAKPPEYRVLVCEQVLRRVVGTDGRRRHVLVDAHTLGDGEAYLLWVPLWLISACLKTRPCDGVAGIDLDGDFHDLVGDDEALRARQLIAASAVWNLHPLNDADAVTGGEAAASAVARAEYDADKAERAALAADDAELHSDTDDER